MVEEITPRAKLELGAARSVGQRLTHWAQDLEVPAIYSRPSVTQTLMVRLPRLLRTRSRVPNNNNNNNKKKKHS